MHKLTQPTTMQTRRLAGLLILLPVISLALLPAPLNADNTPPQSTEQKLKQVQGEISRTEKAIRTRRQQEEKALKTVKQADLALGAVAAKLGKTDKALAANRGEQKQLSQRQQVLKSRYQEQQQALSSQLASAYMSGNHDYLKLLLNQQEPGKIERSLSYYQYLNRARIDAMESLQQTGEELKQVEADLAQRRAELDALKKQQLAQKKQLNQQKKRHQLSLAEVRKLLKKSNLQLSQLQQSENTIQELLSRQPPPPLELLGLGKQKGKLNWPVTGRIKHRFGSRRQGSVKWKGVMMRASEGADVAAIHDGQVVFADWLKGFGLVMVIDHGDGYMSLYGHNQALLKAVGDRVESGEAVALVGRSGGRAEPGLYFEIRHQGRALNPSNWCRRS